MKEILRRQNTQQFFATFLVPCYYVCLLVTAREPWWMDQE
jgi:hypothetical protein